MRDELKNVMRASYILYAPLIVYDERLLITSISVGIRFFQ